MESLYIFLLEYTFRGFIFARIETNYFSIAQSRLKSKYYIPEDKWIIIRDVQIFVFCFLFPFRAEVQSRFPAESTEIIKSISGSKRGDWKNGFTGGWLSFFLLFLSFLSSSSSLSLSFFFFSFFNFQREIPAVPGEFLFRVSKTGFDYG